jgi:hypothetical protein
MDTRTLEALKGSIAKWEAIVAGTGKDEGTENCPLCQAFNGNGEDETRHMCEGCPVREKTRHIGCVGTPYDEYWEDRKDAPKVARRELDFLRSLMPAEVA